MIGIEENLSKRIDTLLIGPIGIGKSHLLAQRSSMQTMYSKPKNPYPHEWYTNNERQILRVTMSSTPSSRDPITVNNAKELHPFETSILQWKRHFWTADPKNSAETRSYLVLALVFNHSRAFFDLFHYSPTCFHTNCFKTSLFSAFF